MKKFLAILMMLVVVLSLGLVACDRDKDTIKVGYTLYDPMAMDEDGELTGFDIEFAEMVLQEMGYNVEFVKIDWNNKVIDLDAYTIDLIWNGMTITNSLKENIALSTPYMNNGQVAVIRKADVAKYTTNTFPTDARIAFENGGAASEYANDELDGNVLIPVTKQVDALLELKANRADVAIIDKIMAGPTLKGADMSDLMVIDNVQFTQELYAIGLRKDDTAFLTELNNTIGTLAKEGKILALAEEYGLENMLTEDMLP